MKILILLTLCFVTSSTSRSTNTEHLERAAAQLSRLSVFQRTHLGKSKEITEKWPEISNLYLDNNSKEINNESNQKNILNDDLMRRIDELATMAYKIYDVPNYDSAIQGRIKRSGSGNFISGIAGKIINGVVSKTGGLSSGSSVPHTYDSYGAPTHPYAEPTYSIWDFKKAIINTLIQALKALAGGAIAVKGHLIKGGGFIVQTTGRVISSAGEATSSLGTQIASSAVISQPNSPSYGAPGYTYDAPQNQDYSYDGPPPSPDATHIQHNVHHHYGEPSDAMPTNEPGLLIVKPINDNKVQHNYEYGGNENNLNDQVHHSQPSLSVLKESFNPVVQKNTKTITKLVGLVTGTSGTPQTNQHNDHVDYTLAEHKDQPLPSLPSTQHYDSSHVHNHPTPLSSDYNFQYDQQQNQHSLKPQLFSSENLQELPINEDHQLAYQQIQLLLNPHLQLPINEAQSFTELSVPNYGAISSFESLKIPIDNHQYYNTFNIGNYGMHGLSNNYGTPTHHGTGLQSIYPNLKRIGIIPRHLMKRMGLMNIVMGKLNDFRVKDLMLHRI